MNLRFNLNNPLRSHLLQRMYEATQRMNYRLVRRIEIILDVLDGREMAASGERYGVSLQTVETYVYQFILKQMASLVYKRPPVVQASGQRVNERNCVSGSMKVPKKVAMTVVAGIQSCLPI